MSQKIAIVAATEKEITPFMEYLQTQAEQQSFQTFHLSGLTIDTIYSGIGILQTTYTLMDYISHRHPDLWIQAGIGGAFDPSLTIGEVYAIQSEMLAGFGAEDKDGRIIDPFELGWNDIDTFPYSNGALHCPYKLNHELPAASGMTTFHSHGYSHQIELLRQQPNGQIENMEGAAFFYISLIRKIPFLSLRSISNYVESRDTSKWRMDLAISKLNQALLYMLEESGFNPDKLFKRLGT